MVLFLQILSMACVIVLLISYSIYRRCLQPDYAEQKTQATLKREARICLIAMMSAIALCIAATLILRKIS